MTSTKSMKGRANVLSLFDTTEEVETPGTATALGPNAREKLAKSKGQDDSTEDSILGHPLWTSVSDCVRFKPEALESTLVEAGLDPTQLVPQAPRAASALTRAATAAELKRQELEKDPDGEPIEAELYANVIFRVAARGVKQMVTEILDAGENRLAYEPVAAIEVDEDGDLMLELLLQSRRLYEVEKHVLKNLHEYYAFERERHDADAVRRAMLRALRNSNSIPLRASGGMYFVQESKEDVTKKILDFISRVRKKAEKPPHGGSNETHAARVELMDSDEYRHWVTMSLEDFIEKESNALIKEMTDLIKSETPVTRKRQSKFIERVRALKADVAEYEELLQYRAVTARSNLDLAGKEARTLLERIAGAGLSTDSEDPEGVQPEQKAS